MSPVKINENIRQFFKTILPISTSASTPLSESHSNSRTSSGCSLSTNLQPANPMTDDSMEATSSQQSSSSLSKPPTNFPQSSSNISNGVVPGSDEEDDSAFSDSSLEDLNVIFKTNRRAPATTSSSTPAPVTSRASMSRKLPVTTNKLSPSAVRTQHKFDMKYLMGTAAADEALEAKERRLEELAQEDTEMGDDDPGAFSDGVHGNILRELNEEKEEGDGKDVQKVMNAIERTEAMNVGSRWYFFETDRIPTVKRQPFPKALLPINWKNDLAEPQNRHQTFVSGFAENMVAYGKILPDEIIQWILDDICMEDQADLRNSYSSIMRVSGEQVHRLVTPEIIRNMFKSIGATSSAITLTDKINPRPEISDAYSHHPWSKVRALIDLINLIAKYLQQETRLEIICILLRLGIDPILLERVDLFSSVQSTLHNLCLFIDPDSWEQSSQAICATLFNTIELPSLRLRIINAIPPIRSSRLHELRRRLALTFYFSSLSKSLQPPQKIITIPSLTQRLKEPAFHVNRNTDYHELASLILLLDVAIDDGRSDDLDLSDKNVEIQFNNDVDELTNRFANFGIKISGAANISRMEAGGILNLVERRIEHTVRTRSKPKSMFYEETKKFYDNREHLGDMQKSMSKFVKKAK
ncbi:hypothetical protein SBOR_8142 [Sclerotinia borealis F-4128]|uniref:Uncharacterized protein n=1 Tax=Sclerotinia borealis (strain F-4128) TaxID=1432307 RepID=W9C6J5_SCLBF|nr:hypothetical protein SBOR_8142 [Sclerotinia borealis F-4128]